VKHLETQPDIPTVGEFAPGYEASSMYSLGAPKNTPTEIVARLNKEINAGLADPKLKARLADLGRRGATRVARRLRQAHRRRNRQVGQSNPSGHHQGGVSWIPSRADVPYFPFLESTTILTHRYRITAKGLRTAIFYTRLYNRSLRTGLAFISPGVASPQLPMAKSIRAAETAVNNWYQNEKIAA
jgi:hypothetical protein